MEIMSCVYPKPGGSYSPLAFLFGIFSFEVSSGSSVPTVRSLFCCAVLASPFLGEKTLTLALKCTFQYILPLLAAMLSEDLVNC